MIVSEQSPTKTYAYSGPGVYAFPFQVTTETDVKARYTDANGVVTDLGYLADYSVTLVAGGDNGGSISNTTNLGTGGSLLIYRHLPLTQLTDWVNAGPIDMEVLENDFDRVTLILQQMNATLTGGLSVVNWKGAWTTGAIYEANNVVQTAGYNLYACVVPHTAGATFAGDLSNGYWRLVADLSVVVTSATNAATSETNAATSETNAATSETNAATSAVLAQQAIAGSHALAEGNSIRVTTSGTSPITSEISLATGADVASTSVDWNSSDVAKAGCSRYLLHGSNPNGPPENIWFFAFTFEYGSKNGDGDLTMLAVSRDSQAMYIRRRLSGSWSEWAKFAIMPPPSGNEGEQLNFESSPSSGLSHLALDVYGTSSSNNHFRMLQRASDDTSRVLDFPIVNGTVFTDNGGVINGEIDVHANQYKINELPAILNTSVGKLYFGSSLTESILEGTVARLKSYTTSVSFLATAADSQFYPESDNTTLGTSGNPWNKLYALNGTIDTSDERLKDVKDIGDTSWVYDLEPIAYQWKDKPAGTRYGFGAQTTYGLMPDKTANLVDKPGKPEDPWGMQPDQLIPLLLNEMKILRKRIEQLEAQVRQ